MGWGSGKWGKLKKSLLSLMAPRDHLCARESQPLANTEKADRFHMPRRTRLKNE